MNKIQEKKYDIPNAAEFLNLSATTVRREILRGNLGSYRLAKRLVIGESHLLDYLNRREQKVATN